MHRTYAPAADAYIHTPTGSRIRRGAHPSRPLDPPAHAHARRADARPGSGGAGLGIAAWGDVVREGLVAPVSLVEEYVGLLTAGSGRVVLLVPVACGYRVLSSELRAAALCEG